jgi:uncharacterized protein (TIGR03083 family)
MDYAAHFRREAQAFLAAARLAATTGQAALAVPSCPGWTVTDLVLHLGYVHHSVARIIAGRFQWGPGRRSGPSASGMRRAQAQTPPGQGERFRFISTDRAGTWAVWFNGENVALADPPGPCDLTASRPLGAFHPASPPARPVQRLPAARPIHRLPAAHQMG